MSAFDRADYQKLLEREMAERRQANGAPRHAQAPVLPENLTGSREWDFFLSILQARRIEIEQQMRNAQELALNTGSTAERERAYVSYREWRHALREIDYIMSLPQQLPDRMAEGRSPE